jgi:hypothetical protein
MVGVLDECSETEKASKLGVMLIEKTDATVRATGPSPASAVMTATPAA